MKGLSLLFQSATSLPFLGFYKQPQAYCLIKYKDKRTVSRIQRPTRNPLWMYQTQIYFDQDSDLIQVFVYNSNSNAEDELLGWVRISKDELNFTTLTSNKFQLINIEGHRIQSFVSISSQTLPHIQSDIFTEKQSIKIQLLNYIQVQKEDYSTQYLKNALVTINYADKSTGLKYGQKSQSILPYKKVDEIQISLNGIKNIKNINKLSKEFNIKNLKQKKPQFFKFRFFDPIFPQINYVACLVFTIIPNSNLPQSFSWIQINIKSQIKDNFIVKCYCPLQTAIIKSLGIPKMLKLPDSQSNITLQYFDCQKLEQKQILKQNNEENLNKILAKFKPYQTISIRANQLEWTSTQRSQFNWIIKKQKITKSLIMEFQAYRQPKTIVKQIYPINYEISSLFDRTIRLSQIKVVSCYFYQILPAQTQIHLYNIDFYGKVLYFGSFIIKPSQSEYIIESRMSIPNDGGQMVFICYELKLKMDQKGQSNQKKQDKKLENQTNNQQFLDNHVIFKVKTDKQKQFVSGKVIYNKFFLSFAKKVTLTKICKKFQQMVHDDVLSVQPKFTPWIPFKQGLLEFVNCQFVNFQTFNSLTVNIGSQSKIFQGFGNQHLCQKSSFFYVKNQSLKLALKMGQIQVQGHYSFGQIFGNPSNNANQIKTYLKQIELKGGKLKLWFKYTSLEEQYAKSCVNLMGQELLNRYQHKFPLKLGLRKIKVLKKQTKDMFVIKQQNQLSLKIRFSQQNNHLQIQTQKSATGVFCFDPQSKFFETKHSQNQEGKYVFLSVQISAAKIQINPKQQKINQQQVNNETQFFYNSVIDISKILGQGTSQIKIYDNKTGKLEIIVQVQCLSENLSTTQSFSASSKANPSLALSFNSLFLANKMKYLQNFTAYDKSYLKSIYNYFAIILNNGFYFSLIVFDIATKNCESSTLPVKQTFYNKNLYLDCKSSFDIRILSSLNKKMEGKQLNQKFSEINQMQGQMEGINFREVLTKMEIQVIGSKIINFSQLKLKKEENKMNGEIQINFIANKQMTSKFTIEQISLIKKSSNFTLNCQLVKEQKQVQQKSQQIVQRPVKNIDVSILSPVIVLVKINQIIPKTVSLLQNIMYEDIQLFANSTKLQFNPLFNMFKSQAAILVSQSEIQFMMKTKNQIQVHYKVLCLPSYLKTNQKFNTFLQISQFVLFLSIQCFSNTLTSFNNGQLILKDLSFANQKIDKVKISYPSQQNSEQIGRLAFEKPILNNMCILKHKIPVQKQARDILKDFLIVQMSNESCNKKLFFKVYLSQLSLLSSSLNADSKVVFADQFQVLQDRKPLILNISGQYVIENVEKADQKNTTLIKYNMLGQKNYQVEIPQKLLNLPKKLPQPTIKPNSNIIPSRQNGVKLQLQLTQNFLKFLEEQNLQYLLDEITIFGRRKQQEFILLKSKQYFNKYYRYLPQIIEVKKISFKQQKGQYNNGCQHLKIQNLNIMQAKNTSRPLFKFIVNQNPQFILQISENLYQIPKAIRIQKQISLKQSQQSFIIKISVHKLLAEGLMEKFKQNLTLSSKNLSTNEKRLMWLKTSLNDQILTNKLCLYFKHGKQEQIIYGVDLQGNLKNKQIQNNIIKFGYDTEDDEIDIFLCVEQFWNKKNYQRNRIKADSFIIENYSYNEIQRQWMQIMPLNHYLIKISDIKSNNFLFASVMKPFKYTLSNISLAKQLSERVEKRNVSIFGLIQFEYGNWGSLTVKINKIGPLKFKYQMSSSINGSSTLLCYLKLSIQYKKSTIRQITTQAKQIIQNGYLSFKTFLNYCFLQNKTESDKKFLKFEMFTISQCSSEQKIFEKRYPLEEILSHQMRNQKININISESDTNNLAQHFQMQLCLVNTKQLQKQNVFSSASNQLDKRTLEAISQKNVDQVDIVSYKNKSFIDILKLFLGSKEKSHFMEYLNQIKESFIYEEITFDKQSSPFGILVILLPYLMTNMRFCFKDILQMIQMAIVKNLSVIKQIQKLSVSGQRNLLYNVFEILINREGQEQFLNNKIQQNFQQNTKQLLNNFNQLRGKVQKLPLEYYFTQKNMDKLINCIKAHSKHFNTEMISQKPIDEDIFISLYSISEQIIQYSPDFMQNVFSNIKKWIDFSAASKSLQILTKMIQIIDKISLLKKQQLSRSIIESLMQIIIDKKVQIDIVYQYWIKQKQNVKLQSFKSILSKYYLQRQQKTQTQIEGENQQALEYQKARILKLLYSELNRMKQRSQRSRHTSKNNSKHNSVDHSQIQIDQSKISQNIQMILIIQNQLIENYKQLFEKTLVQSEHANLLNAIGQLIIFWKSLDLISEEQCHFVLLISKKYLQKNKKLSSKAIGLNVLKIGREGDLKREQVQKNELIQKNKRSILENLIKHLLGKDKIKVKVNQETEKKSEGFSKYSKYLITR